LRVHEVQIYGNLSLRLEGFGIPDVFLLSSIYERSTMRVLADNKLLAAINLDIRTVQGSALSSLLFQVDCFVNALLRLLDSSEISHRVRRVPKCQWNQQAFADDLFLYVSSRYQHTTTARWEIIKFQLKISIKKSLVTGALYRKGGGIKTLEQLSGNESLAHNSTVTSIRLFRRRRT